MARAIAVKQMLAAVDTTIELVRAAVAVVLVKVCADTVLDTADLHSLTC